MMRLSQTMKEKVELNKDNNHNPEKTGDYLDGDETKEPEQRLPLSEIKKHSYFKKQNN
jgi:hypothetical protein